MACCCSKGGSKAKKGPIIGIAGATGFIGKAVTGGLLQGLADDRMKELRIFTQKKCPITDDYGRNGAKIEVVDFSNQTCLVKACTGVDIMICTIGCGPGTDDSKRNLLNALTAANVGVYFPSEFGVNHYTRAKHYVHPVFEAKKNHFKEAQAKEIRVIGIMCSFIMEGLFQEWFGMDNTNEVWCLVGTGDVPIAITAATDLGLFTLEAVIKAYKDPMTIPEWIEVCSDIKSLKECAKVFDRVAGKPTTLEFIPLAEAVETFNSNQDFMYLLRILMEDGQNNYKDAKGNEILNPGCAHFKLKKIEEYAEETNGRP